MEQNEPALTSGKSVGVKHVLISAVEISAAIDKIAFELDAQVSTETPLLIGVLNGAITFMSDLMRAMESRVEIDFMAVSSYGNDTESSGVVRIMKDLNHDIRGRHVIVIEDIVDSGLTLKYLLDLLNRRDPASITVVALLRKITRDAVDVQVDLVAFEIPDEFVVGYGLDYAGEYRNLPYIGVLEESVFADKS